MHFAIVQNWGLGDLVMTTPVISEFRRLHPQAELTLIVRGKPQAALMAGSPLVNQIVEMPPSSDRAAVLSFFRDLRRQHIDVAFIGTRIGGWLPWMLRGIAGIPTLVGDGRREKYPFIFQFRNRVDPAEHRVDRMLRTFSLWSGQPPAPATFPLSCGEDAMHDARSILEGFELQPKQFIVLHPGSSVGSGGTDKRIPVDVARRLADNIVARSPHLSVAFTFGPDDMDLIDRFGDLGPRQVGMYGHPLATTMAVIDLAAGFIGSDSALGHIAAALRVPTATLFGPTIPTETAPYGGMAYVFKRSPNLDCQPCWGTQLYGSCPYGTRCMRELPETDVISIATTWQSIGNF